MKKIILLLVLFCFSFSVQALSQEYDESNLDDLKAAKTIQCYFDKGTSAKWENGELKMETGKFSEEPEENYFTLGSIDLNKGTALVIGDMGSSDIKVYASAAGLTFYEESTSGNHFMTTIFPIKIMNKYLMVSSRHTVLATNINGNVVKIAYPQQYYGTAEILELLPR